MKYKILALLLIIIFCMSGSVHAEENLTEIYKYTESLSGNQSDSDLISIGDMWTSGEFSNTLEYGIPSERSVKTLNSSGEKCRISVSEISGGIRVIYDYYTVGIKYPVEYVFEKDYLKASINASGIEENGEALAVSISVLPLLGSAESHYDGYFVIPDGCGALIRFDDKKDSYSRRVYGDNITAVPDKKSPDSRQIYLPCYGIVKNGKALLATAVKGDSNVLINACTGDLNICNFSFVIRDTDTFSISENDITVFESGDIKCDDIEVRYYNINKNNADYSDIAEKYREYITEAYNLEKIQNNYSPLYIRLYGGVEKEVSLLGIPADRKTALTGYSQARDILESLNNKGISDIVSVYYNWTDSMICSKTDTKARPSEILGGNKDFKNLIDYVDSCDTEIYPVIDNIRFSGGLFRDMTVRISGAYSGIPEYNPAYGTKDKSGEVLSLLSPASFKRIYSELASGYKYDRISFGELSYSLYGDYSDKKYSRYDMMKLVCELCESFDSKILAESPNAYMLPYVSHIVSMPVESSHFDIFDEDIPFYQMAVHGLISYSSEPVNSMPNPEKYIMKSVSYGSCLSFDFISENTDIIQGTALDSLYYADYSGWSDSAVSGYKYCSELLEPVSSCFIEDYYISDGYAFTVYSDGTVVKINPDGVIAE